MLVVGLKTPTAILKVKIQSRINTEVVAADWSQDFPHMQSIAKSHVSQHQLLSWSTAFLHWRFCYFHLETYMHSFIKILNTRRRELDAFAFVAFDESEH